jgi:hypothetical protein
MTHIYEIKKYYYPACSISMKILIGCSETFIKTDYIRKASSFEIQTFDDSFKKIGEYMVHHQIQIYQEEQNINNQLKLF